MLNPHRFMPFTALAALFTASALDPAAAVTPTSPNKDQTVGKASPQTVPEDPATSGSSTEPLSESSIARARSTRPAMSIPGWRSRRRRSAPRACR